MVLMLEKDQSFSLNAYVTSSGPQSAVLSGYIYEDRADGRYVAPLIPELFYGANGSQLQGTWRQNLTTTGDQVILSRGAGDNPHVPRQELWWRKVSDYSQPSTPATTTTPKPDAITQLAEWWEGLGPTLQLVSIAVGVVSVGLAVYGLSTYRPRRR